MRMTGIGLIAPAMLAGSMGICSPDLHNGALAQRGFPRSYEVLG